jgi:hypothetical protein
MINYTGIWGSDEAGIWTKGYRRQVLSARELGKLGVDLVTVIRHDWSDAAIDDLIARNDARMDARKDRQ